MMNTKPKIVPERWAPGPGARPDRRVQRTRQALTHALIALVGRKRYQAITIQDLLDEAGVGRSTFYQHYRGKDDLLLRSFEGLLLMLDRSMGSPGTTPRVAPVAELFHHVGGSGPFHRSLARAGLLDRLYEAGTTCLSQTIARRFQAKETGGRAAVPPSVEARLIAGALFGLLRWWVGEDTGYTPAEMDVMFHTLNCRQQAAEGG